MNRRAQREHGLLATIVGREPPIVAVHYDDEFTHPSDSGYLLLFSDGPKDPADVTADDFRVLCLHCLIEDHPEVGRGLDLARERGEANLVDDEWVG